MIEAFFLLYSIISRSNMYIFCALQVKNDMNLKNHEYLILIFDILFHVITLLYQILCLNLTPGIYIHDSHFLILIYTYIVWCLTNHVYLYHIHVYTCTYISICIICITIGEFLFSPYCCGNFFT